MRFKHDFRGWFYKFKNYCRVILYVLLLAQLVKLKMIIRGVSFGRNVKFNGFPMVRRVPYSHIILGNNCEINSSRYSIPLGLYRPCAFVTIKKGAEIIIGDNSGCSGVSIAAAKSIRIGKNVLIGAFCTIIDNDFHNSDPARRIAVESKPVVIEDNVFLGFNCFVLKGVTIGKNSVIGANSVVISSIPPNSLAMGNPCKVVLKRDWD